MNTPNKIVRLDVGNLRRPLETLTPMQLCAYTLKVVDVPNDARDLQIVVGKTDGTHFTAVPMTQDSNGDWWCNVIGLMFPTAGEVKYQIGMTDGEGRHFAGGYGKVLVTAFDEMSGGAVTPDGDIILTAVPDEQGNPHHIKAVKVDGEWTWQIAD